MSILCTICARSGSKGLKNKNFLKINGVLTLRKVHKTVAQN